MPLGPAPVHFEEVVGELEEGGKIQQFPIMRGKFEQQKFLSSEKPNIYLLTGKEVQLIEEDIARYVSMNATQISAFSHRDMPYKATGDGDIIDYELVFYRDPIFSVREYGDNWFWRDPWILKRPEKAIK